MTYSSTWSFSHGYKVVLIIGRPTTLTFNVTSSESRSDHARAIMFHRKVSSGSIKLKMHSPAFKDTSLIGLFFKFQ